MKILPTKAFFALCALALLGSLQTNAASFQPIWSRDGMVASSVGPAAAAGASVLAAGGNAVDAAVASGFAAAVAHPFSSGIGGGLFAVTHMADGNQTTALDAREVAPASADQAWYAANQQAIRRGPYAVGVPGFVQGLEELHRRYGSKPWAELVQPAIDLAENGVPAGHWQYRIMQYASKTLGDYPETARIYLDNGKAPEMGWNMIQKDLATTLRQIQKKGSAAMTEGAVPAAIEKATKRAVTAKDMAGYKVKWREPLRGSYRGYEVVSMPPPSSGGVLLLNMLNMLEQHDLKSLGHGSSTYVHLLSEVMKLAYADRARYLGDADFDDVPVQKLVSEAYASQQLARISMDSVLDIKPFNALPNDEGTTHISVIDGYGNAVALTQTINSVFGSLITVPGTGIVLNNEMDDFSVAPNIPNEWEAVGFDANRVEPGKRPLSSMTPTLVFEDGKVRMVVGSPMGTTIISSVMQALLNRIDFGMNAQAAVQASRVHHQWYPAMLMHEPELAMDVRKRLIEIGHQLRERSIMGAVQIAEFDPQRCLFFAGVDGRRDSAAASVNQTASAQRQTVSCAVPATSP
ncbi:MAG: gamma-glutamyltransferase [Pseudomonadota bacterium]